MSRKSVSFAVEPCSPIKTGMSNTVTHITRAGKGSKPKSPVRICWKTIKRKIVKILFPWVSSKLRMEGTLVKTIPKDQGVYFVIYVPNKK